MSTHEALLEQLSSPEHAVTRGGGELGEDQKGFRNAVADSLRDAGRDGEADLVQDHGQHVVVHEGQVKKGRYTHDHINHALTELDDHLWEHLGDDYSPPVSYRGHRTDRSMYQPFYPNLGEEGHPMHITKLPGHLADTVNEEVGYSEDEGHLNDESYRELIHRLRTTPFEEPAE